MRRGAEAQQRPRDRFRKVRIWMRVTSQRSLWSDIHLSRCSCRPSVAILATGDEIVDLDMRAGAVIRSETRILICWRRAFAQAAAFRRILPIARDTQRSAPSVARRGTAARHAAGQRRSLGRQVRSGETRAERTRASKFISSACVFSRAATGFRDSRRTSRSSACLEILDRRLVTFQLFARPALEILAGEPHPILPLLSARISKRRSGTNSASPAFFRPV